MSFNKIEDISVVSNFCNLENLYLDNNKIKDILPLTNLKNLKSLDLSCNKITDIAALESLVMLEYLDLSYNNINNLHLLSPQRFPKLVKLRLRSFSSSIPEEVWSGEDCLYKLQNYLKKL